MYVYVEEQKFFTESGIRGGRASDSLAADTRTNLQDQSVLCMICIVIRIIRMICMICNKYGPTRQFS